MNFLVFKILQPLFPIEVISIIEDHLIEHFKKCNARRCARIIKKDLRVGYYGGSSDESKHPCTFKQFGNITLRHGTYTGGGFVSTKFYKCLLIRLTFIRRLDYAASLDKGPNREYKVHELTTQEWDRKDATFDYLVLYDYLNHDKRRGEKIMHSAYKIKGRLDRYTMDLGVMIYSARYTGKK